jgi:branched-chain amino acid transport system substrate-binding protein
MHGSGPLRALVVSIVLAWGAANASAAPIKDINVAVVAPLSGAAVAILDPAIKSFKMAIEEANAKGITIGGERYRFKVSWFDEECRPQTAVSAARAALSQVQPLVIVWGALCSGSALATAPIFREAKAVVLNPTSGTSGFAGPAGNPYLFKIKEGFDERSRSLTRYLAARGLRRGAIVAVNSDWGEEAVRSFKKSATEAGLEIVQTISYDEQSEEFIPLLARVRRADPDFIFQASQLINEQIGFLRGYRQLGLKTQLIGESTWTEDVADKAGWKLIDGMLVASAWVPTDERTAVQAYLSKYRSTFGATPGFNGPPAYDTVRITVQALEKAGTTDPEVLRRTLMDMTFGDLTYGGGELSFNKNGQADFPISITVFDASKHTRSIVTPIN